MNTILRSPLPWVGGKYYSAQYILQALPPPETYDVYVELFGGAAHVLIQKPPYKHIEVYNDINGDLVNFWMQCREHSQELEQRCRTLPYSRSLYYQYHKSLFDGTAMGALERAIRWFYTLRSSFSGQIKPVPNGWSSGAKSSHSSPAKAYQSAIDLFSLIQRRMQQVVIDNRDFADVFKLYNRARVLFYADPPYIGHEHYYKPLIGGFQPEDHKRLAMLLNKTQAYVALSYYPHPSIKELYPETKWRRISWETVKHSQRTRGVREKAVELLLTNYDPPSKSLWESEVTSC